ncbi:MAG: RHS repeat-associated core domain-containing protein [Acidobacteriota bacterium]
MLDARRWWFVLLLSLVTLVGPATAYNPNQPQGFPSDRAFHQAPDLPDQVDLFSGRLSLVLPVGPLTLVYNNNVWRYTPVIENMQPRLRAEPDRQQNAGFGWHLGWGELYPPGHWYNNSAVGQWLYVGDQGTRHVFYGALHRNEDDGDLDVYYTRDNSYLRLRKIVAGSTWDVEFPDGSARRFVKAGAGQPYRLVSGWDSFGSASDADFTVTYSSDNRLRTMTDRYGRRHHVHLAVAGDQVDGQTLSWMGQVVTKVDAQGVNGQRLEYYFTYRNILVSLSCKNTSTQFGPRIRLPHLVRIDQPDGTAYVMQDGGTPSYVNVCPAGIDDAPGSLTRMVLPTGGELRWTYQEYEFPPGHNWGPFNTSAGVATREVVKANGSVLGSWNYVTRDFGGTQTQDPEVWTDVVASPEGDCSRHFFSAINYVSPSQGKGWEYGLPFVRSVQNAGRFLSSEVYTGHNASSMLCQGTKLRSTFVRFRHDPIPGVATDPGNPTCEGTTSCSRLDEWFNTNRTLDAQRIVFHDDGNRWTDLELSQFDGIGNFRRAVTTGNLWSGSSNQERREVFTNFTRSPGTVPGGGYSHPDPSDPWILGVFDRVDTTESEALGERTSRVVTSFDDVTGALECSRTLRSGVTASTNDILVTYDRNGRGLVTDVKSYGADRNPLPPMFSRNQMADCGPLPAQPSYWDHHEYDYGVLARTRPFQPTGKPGLFLTYDVTVDPASGVTLSSRDASGYETTYQYDGAGRVSVITPQDRAATTLTYVNPVGIQGARLRYVSASGVNIFREEEQVLDSFGRVVENRRRMPGSVWSSQSRDYTARGWLTQVTEVNEPNLRTRYLDYDPFGRPGTIRPPEGANHDISMTYRGEREVTYSVPIQLSLFGNEGSSTRIQRFDSYGRLREVLEPSAPSGGNITTDYLYDVAGRLTRIGTTGGDLGQVRTFTYDNRGFLLTESHPEKGPFGGGTVHHSSFDTRGLALRKLDHNNDLGYQYDFLGRMQRVYDRNQGNRTLRSFTYDSAPGFGRGKVRRATAFNYLNIPSTGVDFTVKVTHDYRYQASGGAVNRKDTIYEIPNGAYTMRTDFAYDGVGQVTALQYPRCVSGPLCAASPVGNSLVLDQQYDFGFLTAVPGWASNISYHPSGLYSRIDHSNGVIDQQILDSSRRDRPRQLTSSGFATAGWDSGLITYDGSGNIKQIGADRFAYDKVGRLSRARIADHPFNKPIHYAYDIFGNLVQRDPVMDPATGVLTVDPLTNRLTSATYDGAGNVLSWNGQLFSYDPFNRLTNQAWMIYAYDAYGERAASFAANSTAPFFHLRGLGQELLSTVYLDGQGTFERQKDFIYANGRPLASIGDRETVHYHLDHLGSQRLVTRHPSGQEVWRPVILPYGQEVFNEELDNRLFTGHERDFSYGTDYMHTRHYSSDMARFLSVDSFRGVPSMPQSLNRYSYVMGNPMNSVDPDGRFGVPWVFVRAAYAFWAYLHSEVIEVIAGGGGGGFSDEITVTGRNPGVINGLPPFDVSDVLDPEPLAPVGPRRGTGPRQGTQGPDGEGGEPEVPEVEVPGPADGLIDPNIDPNLPPCGFTGTIESRKIDRSRYAGFRFIDDNQLANVARPFGGAIKPALFFFKGKSFLAPGKGRDFWIKASRLNISRRNLQAGGGAAYNAAGRPFSSGQESPGCRP